MSLMMIYFETLVKTHLYKGRKGQDGIYVTVGQRKGKGKTFSKGILK